MRRESVEWLKGAFWGFLACGMLFLLWLFATPARAELRSFVVGERVTGPASVCVDKGEAIKIAKADAKDGAVAGQALFDEYEHCATLMLAFRIVRVVLAEDMKRGGTIFVVEIADPEVHGEGPRLYWITQNQVYPAERRS